MTTSQPRIIALPRYEPLRRHTKGERFYVTPEGVCRSVTTILDGSKDKSFLDQWRERVGEIEADFIRNTAAYRGTKLHEYVENYLLGTCTSPPFCFLCNPYWVSIKPFLSTVRKPVLMEGAVWHPKKYAGTLDCIAYLDDDLDQPTLLDWKTADKWVQPYKLYDYTLQCAAYVKAANHVYAHQGLNIKRAKIVIAKPNEIPQIEDLDEDALEQLFQHFLGRLDYIVRSRPPIPQPKKRRRTRI